MTKGRILLVEDDKALAELLVYHFEREEFEVVQTADGEEALLLASETPPDLVLLDWMIEGVSGSRSAAASAAAPKPQMSHHHADRQGRRSRSRPGPRDGRRRLCHQALLPRELVARVGAVLRRVRPALAGEHLSYADIEMDVGNHKVRRGGSLVQLGPPNSGCCAISSNIPAASSPANVCSIRSGDRTATSNRAPSTSTSAGCARPSTPMAGATSFVRCAPPATPGQRRPVLTAGKPGLPRMNKSGRALVLSFGAVSLRAI
jgi:hypothetical protein